MNENGSCIAANPATAVKNPCRHVYGVYGITLRSEIPLPLPPPTPGELAQIELRTAPASFFTDATGGVSLEQRSGSWYELASLPDGSSYARWRGVGEFLVSGDGSQIVCRQFDMATSESFHVYLLGQALSFALVKSGFEPFHATVVVVEGNAVAFLGESGFGKSSLGAFFLEAGYPMLTDDLLLLKAGVHNVLAYPGPARIKLFPREARRFLGDKAIGVAMNPETEKLILPLDSGQTCSTPIPLKMIYTLAGPGEVFRKQGIRIKPLTPREAFLELVKNTFNSRIEEHERLRRQFAETTQLAGLVPVRKLWFARVWRRLPWVREAVIADLSRQSLELLACV